MTKEVRAGHIIKNMKKKTNQESNSMINYPLLLVIKYYSILDNYCLFGINSTNSINPVQTNLRISMYEALKPISQQAT
jgi:hypothetical protein